MRFPFNDSKFLFFFFRSQRKFKTFFHHYYATSHHSSITIMLHHIIYNRQSSRMLQLILTFLLCSPWILLGLELAATRRPAAARCLAGGPFASRGAARRGLLLSLVRGIVGKTYNRLITVSLRQKASGRLHDAPQLSPSRADKRPPEGNRN